MDYILKIQESLSSTPNGYCLNCW